MTRLSQSFHPYKRAGQRKHLIYICKSKINFNDGDKLDEIIFPSVGDLKATPPSVSLKSENDNCLIETNPVAPILSPNQRQVLTIEREAVFRTKAAIRDLSGAQWIDGVNSSRSQLDHTHIFYFPYNARLDINRNMYIFEARIKSPNRWFQVMSVRNSFEADREFEVRTKIMTSSLESSEPTNIQNDNPRGQLL